MVLSLTLFFITKHWHLDAFSLQYFQSRLSEAQFWHTYAKWQNELCSWISTESTWPWPSVPLLYVAHCRVDIMDGQLNLNSNFLSHHCHYRTETHNSTTIWYSYSFKTNASTNWTTETCITLLHTYRLLSPEFHLFLWCYLVNLKKLMQAT